MMESFFSSVKSYGKWDKTTTEQLTAEDKRSIDHIEVTEGQYGPTACFFLKGTNRVKMVQMDNDCDVAIGAKLDPDSVVFQHYTDGQQVTTRCIANML